MLFVLLFLVLLHVDYELAHGSYKVTDVIAVLKSSDTLTCPINVPFLGHRPTRF